MLKLEQSQTYRLLSAAGRTHPKLDQSATLYNMIASMRVGVALLAKHLVAPDDVPLGGVVGARILRDLVGGPDDVALTDAVVRLRQSYSPSAAEPNRPLRASIATQRAGA